MGYNISAPGSAYPGSTGSEMAYLYYVELGNKAVYDTNGNYQSGWGLVNKGPFQNIQPSGYWSGTVYTVTTSDAWGFNFNDGMQNSAPMEGSYYSMAMAVRDGDTGPSVTETNPFYTTLTLGKEISFDYFWQMGEDPPPYTGQSFDVLALQGGEGWKYIGQIAAYNSSADWLTAMIAVPQEFWGLETQIRFVLNDFGPNTDPTVFLNNIKSAPVPEPTTILLLASGLAGLVGMRRNFNKKES